MSKTLILATMLIAATPADPPRFDLACTITSFQTDDFPVRDETIPLRFTVKVDLASRRYCGALPPQQGMAGRECEETMTVRRIEPTQIILDRDHGGSIAINRESGRYVSDVTYKGAQTGTAKPSSVRMRAYGSCDLAPFTGFPALRF